MIIIFVVFLLFIRVTISGRRERNRKSEDKDEEWIVKRPKAKQTHSQVCISHNTRLGDGGTFLFLQQSKGGATKTFRMSKKRDSKKM